MRDLLIVFDIDETLIQFINKNAYHYWEAITPTQKRTIENELEVKDLGSVKKQVILFRPGLGEFLKMAQKNGRIKVALWTYSERDYADHIADLICKQFGLPADTFIFKYGTEDIKNHDSPKALTQVYDDTHFNKFNTFLVDDRGGNLCHKKNRNNSILVQAFAPFGEKKLREPLTDALLKKATEDTIFKELTFIINQLLRDIDGCSDEEIEEAFAHEPVFAPKCMRRKGLESYLKKYEDDIKLCTIGEVENAASAFKGGRRTHKTKRRSKKMLKKKKRQTRKY